MGIFCSSSAFGGEKLTYIDLIGRLTDLEHLAVLPADGEKCAQWSSYDRASKYDQTTGKYIDWSANNDGTGFIRKEGNEYVFAEMAGPGVIWRIWSANAGQGKVKIYLDGAKEPAVDLPFAGYFDGQNEPFNRSAIVHQASSGFNCYIPISYQKSCKITAEDKWGMYYHFTYTTYPKGTVLPTFKRNLSSAESKALDKANQILANCGTDPASSRKGEVTEQKSVTVAPGQTVTVTQLKGPKAITALRVKTALSGNRPVDCNMLRELGISIRWDGESEPSVWSPLGDFFGTAPGVNKYKSLPLGMTDDSFYSYWYMPFEKSALIELKNDGGKEYKIDFTIIYTPLTRPIEQLGRFHAKWHRDVFLPERTDRWPDWTMLKTEGRGRFCGVMLHVWHPTGRWWGEGDEKFFVDGEKFPSTFGTGSEDYFGYAWCNPALFSNCYHNQTISMGNLGHISVNRWHITDNVPFQKSFEAAIEKYCPNRKTEETEGSEEPALYAAIAYWYQASGQADGYKPVPVEQRAGYWKMPIVLTVKDALEGEDLKVLAKTAGEAVR
jgi:hypothetical protein